MNSNNKLGRITTLILVLFIMVYTGFQTFRFFFVGYKTESAYSFEVARVYTTSGVLIRQEKALEVPYDGTLRYTLPEGGKLINTTPVAIHYSSKTAASLADKTEILEKERQILESVQRGASVSVKPDIASLSSNIYDTLREHTVSTNHGLVGNTQQFRLSLIEDICKIQAAVDSQISFDSKISELDTQIALAEHGNVITIDENGYFSRFSDGYENQFTAEMLDTMNLKKLDELLSGEYPYQQQTFGKIITDYNWYYVTKIPIREVELFQPDVKMTLSFIGSESAHPVSGWVKSITEDKASGQALLVIQSNDISEDTVSRRTATVKLGFDDYRGIRFSKSALRIQDGVKGVYVRGKTSIRFKKVDVVYTGMDFYLSKLDYNSDIYLNIFDEIIVEGTNLYDGKPLE